MFSSYVEFTQSNVLLFELPGELVPYTISHRNNYYLLISLCSECSPFYLRLK